MKERLASGEKNIVAGDIISSPASRRNTFMEAVFDQVRCSLLALLHGCPKSGAPASWPGHEQGIEVQSQPSTPSRVQSTRITPSRSKSGKPRLRAHRSPTERVPVQESPPRQSRGQPRRPSTPSKGGDVELLRDVPSSDGGR